MYWKSNFLPYLVWGSDLCKRIPHLQVVGRALRQWTIALHRWSTWNNANGKLCHGLFLQNPGSEFFPHSLHILDQNICKTKQKILHLFLYIEKTFQHDQKKLLSSPIHCNKVINQELSMSLSLYDAIVKKSYIIWTNSE